MSRKLLAVDRQTYKGSEATSWSAGTLTSISFTVKPDLSLLQAQHMLKVSKHWLTPSP